ncbi:MAG: hypothetical protein ACK5AZ_10365 [Bryobacteraceae bacterium]
MAATDSDRNRSARCPRAGGGQLSLRRFGVLFPVLEASLGFIDGAPAGAAGVSVYGGLASFLADSTLPPWRGRGVHRALIRARLRFAAARGYDLAAGSVQPGSISERNYPVAGFRPAYTKLIFRRELK